LLREGHNHSGAAVSVPMADAPRIEHGARAAMARHQQLQHVRYTMKRLPSLCITLLLAAAESHAQAPALPAEPAGGPVKGARYVVDPINLRTCPDISGLKTTRPISVL
jgi:hypothetical protein